MVAGLGVDEGGLNALELWRVVDLLNRELSGLLKGDEGIKLVTEAICYVRIFNDLGIETQGMPEELLGAHPTYPCQCKGYKFTKKIGKKHASFT
ncbi:hypothetical protein ACFX2J_003357 [Malus domestica]